MTENSLFNRIYMFKAIIAVILFVLGANFAYSQDQLTVTASSTKKDFQLSEQIKVNLKAVVAEGYHMNANKVTDEDLIPTSLNFESSDFKLVKTSWPPAHKFKFS